MHAERIKGLYQQLIGLLKAFRTSSVSQEHIKETLQFSETLIQLMKDCPDPLTSELSVFRPQLPHVVNLTFTTCLLATLLAGRNKFNDSCCQQVICAAITLYCFNQREVEQYFKTGAQVKAQFNYPSQLFNGLQKAHLDVWANCFDTFNSQKWQILHRPFVSPGNRRTIELLALANGLSINLIPKQGKASLNYANVVKLAMQSVSSKYTELLHPLLNYPGLTPPGSVVKVTGHGTSIVLSQLADEIVVKSVKAPTGEPHLPLKVSRSSITLLSPPRESKSFALLDDFWDANWETLTSAPQKTLSPYVASFRLDKPPSVLIEVQNHLNHADIDFNKLAHLISNEPSLANHLKDSASQSSRSKLPVQDVKHGLMMHGYERTNSILIQQALLLRLNQNFFPLQESFIQFTRLRCHLAASIIALKDKSLTEQANCLACFATSGLFTVPTLKGVEHWLPSDNKPFDVRYLVAMEHQQSLHDNAIKLAEAWHQSPQMIMALRNHLLFPEHMPKHKTAAKLAITMGLSLMLARKIFFAENPHCQEGARYLQQSTQHLGITRQQLDEITLQSVGYCHSFWVISD